MVVDAQALESPAAVESTADPSSAVTPDSTDAGDAVESPVAGDDSAPSPTPEGDTSAEAGEGEDDDEPKPDETPDERKTRSQRRKERLEQQIEQRVQAALAKSESERKATEAQQQTAEQARQAALARQQALHQYIGVPDAPGRPGTLTTLRNEIDTLNRQIRSELTQPQGADLDALTQQVAEREARFERTRENLAMSSQIEEYVWSQLGNDFASAAQFPELASDPAKQSAYLNAQGGVGGALRVLADTIRSAKDAEKTAALKDLSDKHSAEVKALRSEVSNWRVRAGAEEVPDVGTGRAATGGPGLTLERYRSMTTEERLALTPAQRDAMVARHVATRR